MPIRRRSFLQSWLLAVGGWALTAPLRAQDSRPPAANVIAGDIIDTNVHLFCWPFRDLKYSDTDKLVEKLRRHGIRRAWAGSFESLLHRNIDGVNRKLVETCRRQGDFLLPFGSVNPVLPDWQEDLRRCHEVYGMAGIRLHPGYEGYDLRHPAFAQLLKLATERKLIVQIAVEMEDERVHHPMVNPPAVDSAPLPALVRALPNVRIQFLNAFRHLRGEKLRALLECPQVTFECSNLDGVGALQKILAGRMPSLPTKMPLDRMMFGSHAPYFPVQNSLLKFVESKLSDGELKAIMAGNAERWLGRT